jgi:phospholipid-binding lipoprotein MlaA
MSAPAAALLLVLNPTPVPAAVGAEDVAQVGVSSGAETQPAQPPEQAQPPAPALPPIVPAGPDPILSPPVFVDLLPASESPAAESVDPESEGSEIIVTAREETPGDPLSDVNAKSYEAIQAADAALVAPVAGAYEDVVPEPLRDGLRNFLRNLEEPVIAVNYLLQLKPGRAAKSVARFAVNSTIGVAGLVDVAKKKPFNLPYTPNGFANTLACYGVGPGPYLYLPLIGPTTVRDLIGVTLDRAALPAVVGPPLSEPYYAIPSATLDSLNDRIEIDDQLKQLRENSGDPYAEARDLYLKQRKSEIAAICPKKGETVDEALPPRPGKGKD